MSPLPRQPLTFPTYAMRPPAPESPWTFPVDLFASRADAAARQFEPTPSNLRALEALPEHGAVLDVGCGAGAASLPLAVRAGRLVGVVWSDTF